MQVERLHSQLIDKDALIAEQQETIKTLQSRLDHYLEQIEECSATKSKVKTFDALKIQNK